MSEVLLYGPVTYTLWPPTSMSVRFCSQKWLCSQKGPACAPKVAGVCAKSGGHMRQKLLACAQVYSLGALTPATFSA